jgi:PAS domain S-box-containing protein
MDTERLLELMYRQVEVDALILLDPDGKVVAWLMGARRVFGHSADEMVGRGLDCLFTPEDQADGIPESELEQARRTRSSEDDRWMVRRDNMRFWATGFVHCLRDDDGRVAGYAKILSDRTDLRGQYETLRNRVDAYVQEDRRTTLVLGTLAHELRNPLSAMSNAVQLMALTPMEDPKLAYAQQVIERQVKYVSALIEDLFETARARTGKAVLTYETIDVATLMRDAIETVAAQIREKRLQVEILEPPTPLSLEGDRIRLTQVLVNLLGNAAKFSGHGTRICIKTTVEGDEGVIRIEDQGRGIPPELLPHVFELLSQAHGTGNEPRAGLGLGLALVREYVEMHGGTVQVRSEGVGRGSEFTVRLPLKRDR